jgi:cell volume regulation protein A
MAVLLTVGAIELWRDAPSVGDWVLFGVVQLGGGALVGIAVGRIGSRVLNAMTLPSASAYPVFALSLAAIAYGASVTLHASGFLAVYIAGLVVGSRVPRHHRLIQSFHAGLGSVAEIGLFLLLGLLVNPGELPALAVRGLVIAVVLVLVARPIAVASCLPWFGARRQETTIVAWAGLRGAVPIVLATFPLTVGHPKGIVIFDIVFFVVFVSAAVQGITVSPLARRLGLRADRSPWEAMVEVEIEAGARVAGRTLASAPLPDGARVAAVFRADEVVVPDGATRLQADDRLLVVAQRRGDLEALVAWAAASGPGDAHPPPD